MQPHRNEFTVASASVGSEKYTFSEPPSFAFESRWAGERNFDYYTGTRPEVISMIPSGVRSVLEVGCAGGGTGKALRARGISHLIGIEINPEAARFGGHHYDRLIIGDAELTDDEHIESESLDCILYADVLEHMRDPWSTLRRHLHWLRPGGYVVASIPNVRYYKAVQDLVLKGRWEYANGGVLDKGHLRFFTLCSVTALFERNGLRLLELDTIERGSDVLKLLNRVVLNRLRPFLVKQYLVLGQKTARYV